MTAVLAILAVVWGMKIVLRGLELRDIVFGLLAPTAWGYWQLVERGAANRHGFYLYCTLFLVFYVAKDVLNAFGLARVQRDPSDQSGRSPASAHVRVLRGLTILTAVGVVYHFAAGGIPLLDPVIDLARFDVTSSGLYGVPGRIYLFGAPLLYFVAATRREVLGARHERDVYVVIALVILVISRVLGGFKSGFLEIVIVASIGVLAGVGSLDVGRTIRRFVPLILGASLFAVAVGSTYVTYSGRSLSESLKERLTVVAAQPAAIAMDRQEVEVIPNGLENDFLYFANRYFHVGPGRPYAYDRVVSATILKADPSGSYFLPPVTVGGQAGAYRDLGWFFASLYMFLLGSVLALCEAARGSGMFRATLLKFGSWLVILVMIKGNLAYHVLNLGTVALLYLTLSVILRPSRTGSRGHASLVKAGG